MIHYYSLWKNISLALLIFICYEKSIAQTGLPQGATWHIGIIEGISSSNQGYALYVVDGDTIIQSTDANIIRFAKYNSQYQQIDSGNAYFYADSSRIYHYYVNDFYKLYDFNLMPGDSWEIVVPYPSPYTGITFNSLDTIVTVIVDSIGTININGQTRKLQYVHSDSNDWIFLNPIIEGIGSIGGIFPAIFGWQDYDLPYLRCYNDSIIYFNAHSGFACDSIINSAFISEDNETNINVFPNPAKDIFNISSNEHRNMTLSIIDNLGVLHLRKEIIYPDTTIDIAHFLPGIYYCIISFSNKRQIYRLIVI